MVSAPSLELAALVTEEAVSAGGVILRGAETAFVSETPTGLAFSPETPLEVWAPLVVRLIVQSKRLEWALSDALVFGELAYGDLYAQWAQETGLNKRTLQNYARVGRLVEPARRRADVSFSHHEAVAKLPPEHQDDLLDAAVEQGWSRYDLRDAVRERREQLAGKAVDATGAPVEPSDDLGWHPTKEQLTDEARAALEIRLSEMAPSRRSTFEAGFLFALVYADALDCFMRDGEGGQ